jgi:transposase
VDLAKRVIQVHVVDGRERVLSARALAREMFIAWCARLPAGCVVAMEASSSAHHCARNAAAICEAASRPTMRFIPVKSIEQQSMLCVHRLREGHMTAHRRQDRISSWVGALGERSGWQKAGVALANKNARIPWAVMTRGIGFDPNHLSAKPVPA